MFFVNHSQLSKDAKHAEEVIRTLMLIFWMVYIVCVMVGFFLTLIYRQIKEGAKIYWFHTNIYITFCVNNQRSRCF